MKSRLKVTHPGAKRQRIVTIEVPWIGPSGNQVWTGLHWGARKKIADEGHLAVMLGVRLIPDCPHGFQPFTGPVSLEFQAYQTNLYDIINLAIPTCKVIEDGLVRAGFLQGDDPKIVKRITINCPVKVKPKETRMEVIIRTMGEL